MRDFQQSKVYNWESFFPNGKHYPFDEIKDVVTDIWSKMNLQYPPLVKPFPKQVTKWAGDATRFTVRFPEHGATYKTIIHELAHSMTASVENVSHQHNEVFVGMYMVLLEKFMNIDVNTLHHSATIAGVKFTTNEVPRITNEFQ